MSYVKVEPQPAQRDPKADPENIGAPGLYPGEIALQLDTGDLVALAVEGSPSEVNTGMVLYAWARAINPDGSTKMFGVDPGVQIVTETKHTACHAEMETTPAQTLADELVKAIMGEPPTMIDTVDAEGKPMQQALLAIDNRDQISIVNMLAVAASSTAIGVKP